MVNIGKKPRVKPKATLMTYIIYWIDPEEPQIISASKSEFETAKKTGVLILNNLGRQTTIRPKYIAFTEIEPIKL